MVDSFPSEVVMNRLAFASAVALLSCAVSAPTFAQAKKTAPPAKAVAAAPTTPAPAAPAKWVPPVKGMATVDLQQKAQPKVIGKEIVTTLKLKNTSTGSINLLKADQLWYDKKRAVVSSATAYYRKPFLPGEVIELELRAPRTGQEDVNQMTFAHANGNVKATKVKDFK
jgi:hypothetical protein